MSTRLWITIVPLIAVGSLLAGVGGCGPGHVVEPAKPDAGPSCLLVDPLTAGPARWIVTRQQYLDGGLIAAAVVAVDPAMRLTIEEVRDAGNVGPQPSVYPTAADAGFYVFVQPASDVGYAGVFSVDGKVLLSGDIIYNGRGAVHEPPVWQMPGAGLGGRCSADEAALRARLTAAIDFRYMEPLGGATLERALKAVAQVPTVAAAMRDEAVAREFVVTLFAPDVGQLDPRTAEWHSFVRVGP